ncbi:SLC13 family permease [Curtanaerobium respiraculi]|uniref:SLC13 family permease n=1 Tax=Curtanaerobium respiraculi TaxID=2949669 RepID=UPI0024B392E5|nr:SLC13 family permease [Curtanaerobium respiraculi]
MEGEKKKDLTFVHAAIGAAICAIFWIIPPIAPITEVGMRCVGGFLAMVYLWSAVGTLWPSIFGLFMISISGIGVGDTGSAQFNNVWMTAVGTNTVLLTLFAMTLFGAVDEVGVTKYIARWLLTRKVYAGKPIAFLAVFYLCCFVLSTLVTPIAELIMLWPVAIRVVEVLEIKREDPIWKWFFVGMFLVSTLGQPFFPFMGAQLIPLSAFATMTQQMGMPMEVPMVQYMFMDLIMTAFVMALYLVLIKLMRVDTSKFKAMDPKIIEEQMPLPAMNFQQKAFLYMIPLYLIAVLLPQFIKGNPVSDFLNMISTLGITILFTLVMLVIKWNGKPLLDFQRVAYKQMNWGIFFMIAAAVYAAGTLSNKATGVTEFLMQTLTPILGGQPEMIFIALMFTVALVITNFANNAAMAVVLMPVVINFSNQLGINPIPVAAGVVLMVFVAMLTPAASPHAGMMWGRRDLYTPKDILSIGLPMCAITLVSYIFVGYPLLKMIMG